MKLRRPNRQTVALRSLLIFGLLLLNLVPRAAGYSVLTHEAIVDSMWDTTLKGLLLTRFPDATPEQLLDAHAYTYGGAIIQDMGYYPFGSKLFTDLLHYVRSGDFIVNLIDESQNLNEYAFSLGALAHYAADNNGHRIGTNPSVPLLYPKLRLKFGKHVTYADDPLAHIKTEFGFDVLQVAQGHYAPDGYHRFIGFQVSKPLLERVFEETYGLKMSDVFASVDLAIGSYRNSVSYTIPTLTRAAWQFKKSEIIKGTPGTTRRKFLYNLSRASYKKEWGNQYQRPGCGARVLAFFFRILPPIGPLRALNFKAPTPPVERLFMASFNSTLDQYRKLLSELQAKNLRLPNDNFDVGEVTSAGKYRLSDRTYAQLLDKLEGHYGEIAPDLRTDILAFYSDLNTPIATKADAVAWAKVLKQLDELKALPSRTL